MSIIRPEKRDPNYIRNKNDIGLSKVDNVSSAEFASIVLDQVRRYLNRETVYQTLGRRFIALAKIGCKDDGSGNLIKILSGNLFITFAVLNESEEIREAVKLETIYSHYVHDTEVDYEDDTAKVEYNIFVTEDSALLNKCYLEFRENVYEDASGTTATEMYVILRCDSENLPFVSTNLFEYSNGGVALDPTIIDDKTLSSYTLIKSARLDHNRFSLVDRSEATIGFEIYDEAGNPVRVRETADKIDPDFDIPKINGVPFTGRKGVFVEGKNTRQITVNAMHSGSTLLEAGGHDWEVINYAPRAGYSYYNKDSILRDNIYPQAASFLDKDSFIASTSNTESTEQDKYGYGLCRLSGCGNELNDGILLPNRMFDPELPFSEKIVYLYEWSDSLSKVDTDVIPVRVFKTLVDSLAGLFDDQIKKMAELREILKSLDSISSENKKKLDKLFTNSSESSMGYHYIFDYANTSDSVTIVPHTGMEDKTYEIKMGVIGNGAGTFISMAGAGDIDRGGDTSWVRISRIDNRYGNGGSVTFSFSPNKTNESRYGYYIIYSNAYRTDGSRIGLVYRFYQDVVTSSLRIKYVDEHSLTEYYALGAVVQKKISNDGEILEFDQISVVDNSILDESGNPSRIDRILGYYVDENPAVKIETIRVEDDSKVLGFRVSFPKNNTNDERTVRINILNNNLSILTIELEQNPREFEYTAPDSLIVEGYINSSTEFKIISNKSWTIEPIKGGNIINILSLDTGTSNNNPYTGIVDGKDEVTFNRKLVILDNNTTDKAKEVGILKLYASGDGSKYKRIPVIQNGQPAISSIGTTKINIPYYEEGTTTIDNFYCTYDWVISVSPELKEWCSISPEGGSKVKDPKNPVGTQLVLTTLKTTNSVNNENRGTFTIKYAGTEETIEVIQDKAGFDFKTDATNNEITLNYAKGSSAVIKVESNYDWTIGILHENSVNKKFKACVDNIENNINGVNGSTINIEALDDASSDSQNSFLGSIKIYSLSQVVKEIKVYQSKITISINLSPGDDAGWYANGNSKQKGTEVTVPVKVTPSTATVTATYSISGGAPVGVTVEGSDTAGEKIIRIPSPGSNMTGSNRSITLIARAESSGSSKEDSCSLIQNGFTNGIRVTTGGNSVDYYGGTRDNVESTNYFTPISGNSKTVSYIYEPINAAKLVVNHPSWITISNNTDVDKSENEYLLKTRKTISTNTSGKNKTGEIKITSGEGNDMTVITIPVVQYSGTWYFGTEDSNYSDTYLKDNPYGLSMESSGSSEAALTISTYYTYNDEKIFEDINISMESGSDWCIGSRLIDGTNAKIVFKSSSTNSNSATRTATAKITQNNTGDVFYISITQEGSAKINVYGGVKDVKYVLINSQEADIELTTAQAEDIAKQATLFIGVQEPDGLIKSVLKNNIMYVNYDSNSKKINTEKLINATNGTNLFFASLAYLGSSTTVPTNLRSTYALDKDFSARASFKYSPTGNNIIDLQNFGTNRISFGTNYSFEDGLVNYEYILSSVPSNSVIYWEPSQTDLSSDYYIKPVDNNFGDYYFTIDPKDGVGYFHPGSSTDPTHTAVGDIELYVYKRRLSSDSNNPWIKCGTVLWSPILTDITISWISVT